MGVVIVVSNAKGGSGKTSVSSVLACELARRGRKTLLVDLDPQASQTQTFGLDPYSFEGTEHDIARIFRAEEEGLPVPVSVKENLDLLPSRPFFIPKLETGEELSLRHAIHGNPIIGEGLKASYDYVIVDTGGNLGQDATLAYLCADYFLIPFRPTFLDETGLVTTFHHIVKLAKRYVDIFRPKILGFVVVDFRRNFREDMRRLKERKENIGELLSGVFRIVPPVSEERLFLGEFPSRSVWRKAFGIPMPLRDYVEKYERSAGEVLAEIELFTDAVENLLEGAKV